MTEIAVSCPGTLDPDGTLVAKIETRTLAGKLRLSVSRANPALMALVQRMAKRGGVLRLQVADEPTRKLPPPKSRVREYRWAEFLAERARMIRYFRDVQHKSWEDISRILSCDPVQVELIYLEGCDR